MRGRQRQKQRQIERETEAETDREIERQRDRETDRETCFFVWDRECGCDLPLSFPLSSFTSSSYLNFLFFLFYTSSSSCSQVGATAIVRVELKNGSFHEGGVKREERGQSEQNMQSMHLLPLNLTCAATQPLCVK